MKQLTHSAPDDAAKPRAKSVPPAVMTHPVQYTAPILDSILHPSDFSADSMGAFQHALKAALVARAKLTLLHVIPGTPADWKDSTGVQDTVKRWSSPSQVPIEIHPIVATKSDPVQAVLQYLKGHSTDLIVLAAHSCRGKVQWLGTPIAQPVARKSGQMTLFIPGKVGGFVSTRDGAISLKKILIPIASTPGRESAVQAAVHLVHRLQCPAGTFLLLHVGERKNMPDVQCPEVPGWHWKKLTRTGDISHGIVDTANKQKADLIVMATRGRYGFLSALRGSHSEQVLTTARCPLLTVPEGSSAALKLR